MWLLYNRVHKCGIRFERLWSLLDPVSKISSWIIKLRGDMRQSGCPVGSGGRGDSPVKSLPRPNNFLSINHGWAWRRSVILLKPESGFQKLLYFRKMFDASSLLLKNDARAEISSGFASDLESSELESGAGAEVSGWATSGWYNQNKNFHHDIFQRTGDLSPLNLSLHSKQHDVWVGGQHLEWFWASTSGLVWLPFRLFWVMSQAKFFTHFYNWNSLLRLWK